MALPHPITVAREHCDIECGAFGTCITSEHVLCNKHQLPCECNSFVSYVETGVSPVGHCMKARDWGALFSGLCLVAGKAGSDYLHPLLVTIFCCCIGLIMVWRLRRRTVQ
eukprot:2640217-Amphidinium_carterae.1